MKNTSSLIRSISLRVRGLLLAGLLLVSGSVTPIAYAFDTGKDELPSSPTPRLQLSGTLASANLGPSKLDQGPAQEPAAPVPSLQIAILEGEDVSNNIKERTAREPIVQVTDENHKPVAGAVVLFTITSESGHAGATFANGAKSFQATTDSNGQVTARGFHPNAHTGQFHVNVTASKGNLSARSTIAQTNVAAAAASATTATLPGFVATHASLVSIVAGAAALASVVSVVAVTQPPSGTSISAGTGTVGAPSVAGAVHRFPK